MITNTHSVGVVRDAVDRVARRPRRCGRERLLVVAARGGGDLGRLSQRHQRLSRESRSTRCRRSRRRARAGRRRQRRRRHGHGLSRVQVRHRHGLARRRDRGASASRSACSCRRNYGMRDTSAHRRACPSVSTCAPTASTARPHRRGTRGSIIIVVATDAPLLPHQLKRIARRAALGLARNGSYAGNGSGDLFVAFSTANADGRCGQAPEHGHVPRQRRARSAVPRHRGGDRRGDRQRHDRRARHARARRVTS